MIQREMEWCDLGINDSNVSNCDEMEWCDLGINDSNVSNYDKHQKCM